MDPSLRAKENQSGTIRPSGLLYFPSALPLGRSGWVSYVPL